MEAVVDVLLIQGLRFRAVPRVISHGQQVHRCGPQQPGAELGPGHSVTVTRGLYFCCFCRGRLFSRAKDT